VLPFPSQPRGSDAPNIGLRRSMEALKDECRFNAGKLQKVNSLAKAYGHWRPVRGDGNCYYRTVIYGCLEVMLADESPKRIEQLLETFKKVSYKNAKEQNAHEQMLKIIRSFEDQEQLELWVSQDLILDQALIRACRQLVRMFLMQRAHEQSPSGLTYEQLVRALDSTYSSMEDFCRLVVDPLGRDAETLALDALPQMLGIGLRLWILDRRDEVGLVSLDTPGPAGQV
ncbi:unnamed protein product, partial [Polarella glacialis]